MTTGPYRQLAESERVNVTGTGEGDGEYVITATAPGENGTVTYGMVRTDKIVRAEVEPEPGTIAIRRRDPAEAARLIREGYREHGIPEDLAEAMIEELGMEGRRP